MLSLGLWGLFSFIETGRLLVWLPEKLGCQKSGVWGTNRPWASAVRCDTDQEVPLRPGYTWATGPHWPHLLRLCLGSQWLRAKWQQCRQQATAAWWASQAVLQWHKGVPTSSPGSAIWAVCCSVLALNPLILWVGLGAWCLALLPSGFPFASLGIVRVIQYSLGKLHFPLWSAHLCSLACTQKCRIIPCWKKWTQAVQNLDSGCRPPGSENSPRLGQKAGQFNQDEVIGFWQSVTGVGVPVFRLLHRSSKARGEPEGTEGDLGRWKRERCLRKSRTEEDWRRAGCF